MRICLMSLLLLLMAACSKQPAPIVGCVADGIMYPVCGFSRPEDMELLPDQRTLLISEMSLPGDQRPGALALYDTISGIITRLAQITETGNELWGARECSDPPGAAFSPHGIDLSQRADQRWQLLVVNHGGRESVEYFEPVENNGTYTLAWRGCTLAPPDAFMNDVVALPQGGFLATHIYARNSASIGPVSLPLLKGILHFDTGYVLHWDGSTFSRLPGSSAAYPNGIQISPDGNTAYLDVYLSGEVRKISLPDGRLLASAKVAYPDNIQWDAEGQLLIASHSGGLLQILKCLNLVGAACGAEFALVRLDPDTMQTTELYRHQGAPMGAATVAQQVGERIYLGSFVGDRIVRLPMAVKPDRPRNP